MRLRTFLIAAALVGAFVYLTSRQNSPLHTFLRDSEPIWSGPTVAHSAGLSADENNNIEIYKAAKESVVYITSTVTSGISSSECKPCKAWARDF